MFSVRKSEPRLRRAYRYGDDRHPRVEAAGLRCRERNASLNSSRMVILGQSAQLASVTPPLAASSGRPCSLSAEIVKPRAAVLPRPAAWRPPPAAAPPSRRHRRRAAARRSSPRAPAAGHPGHSRTAATHPARRQADRLMLLTPRPQPACSFQVGPCPPAAGNAGRTTRALPPQAGSRAESSDRTS